MCVEGDRLGARTTAPLTDVPACVCVLQTNKLEERFRKLDEEHARLEADAGTLKTTNTKLSAELKGVYRRWEEDGQRWGMERQRLQDQLQAATRAAATLTAASGGAGSALVPSHAGEQTASKLATAVATIHKLNTERDLLLKNWAEETEILVTIWKQDKAAWAKERQKLVFRAAEAASGAATPATPSYSNGTITEASPIGARAYS